MESKKKFFNNFYNVCRKFPDNISICWVSKCSKTFGITYAELNKVSDELKCLFSRLLANDTSQYVGIQVSDYTVLPILFLALWKNDLSIAGLGSQYSVKDNLKFLDLLFVRFIISSNDCSEYNFKLVTCFYISNQKYFLYERNIIHSKRCTENWDMCYGIMTTGTTGTLKVIQVPWSCILPNAEELIDKFCISELDCVFQASPFTFDPYYIELFFCLLRGCTLLIVSDSFKLCPSALLRILFNNQNNECLNEIQSNSCKQCKDCYHVNIKLIIRKQITVLQITPSLFKRWTNEDIKQVILSHQSSLRILILGGEKFPKEILNLKPPDNKTKIFNLYGITEISCWSFMYEVPFSSSCEEIPLGSELNNIVYKLNDNNELLVGSNKRICLIDEETSLNSKELVFRNTGDIVKVENERLFYVCRSHEIVKKYGNKVNLKKIEESFLNENKSIKSFHCVFNEKINKLGLFYKGKNNCKMQLISYENFIKNGYNYPISKLQDIEKPDYLIEIPDFPLNTHGKCDKTKLLIYLEELLILRNTNLDVRNVFKNAWNDVLGANNFDLNSGSFISFGGNSVLALQLIGKLEDAGLNVPQDLIVHILNGNSFEDCYKSFLYNSGEAPLKKKKKFTEDVVSSSTYNFNLRVKWKQDFGKCIDATPTVFNYLGEKRVIVGSHSFIISCFSISSGDLLWTKTLGGRIESGVAITKDGTSGFVGCYDNFVYCISMIDGSTKWQFKTNDMIKSTPCLCSEEKILFVASYDRHLYILDVESGVLQKKIKLSEKGIFSSGCISNLHNTFHIATLDGTCVSLFQTTFELIWKIKLKSPVFASPCLVEDKEIIFTEVFGTLHCFNIINGTNLWNYTAGGYIYSTPTFYILEDMKVIIFGCNDSNLYCLRFDQQVDLIWKRKLDSSIFSRSSAFHLLQMMNVACAASTKGIVYILELLSGNVLSHIKLNGEVFSSPIFVNNEFVVGCRDNYLYTVEILKK